jgi:hypothetical protein
VTPEAAPSSLDDVIDAYKAGLDHSLIDRAWHDRSRNGWSS